MIISSDMLLVNLAGYPVTITFALLPIWFFMSYKQRATIRVDVLLFFITILFIPFIHVSDIVKPIEFIKSYSLLMMNVFFLFFFSYIRRPNKRRCDILKAVSIAQVLIFLLGFLQFIELKFVGTEFLWKIWGPLTASFTISVEFHDIRVKSFFHEPSHFALISIFLFWIRYHAKGKLEISNFFFVIGSVFLAKSGAGFLLFPVVAGHMFFVKKNWFIVAPLIIFLALPLGIFLISTQTAFTKYAKIEQLQNTESVSSAYMRWILPINILKAHWEEGRYLGYGLGQLENDYFKKVDKLIKVLDVKEGAIANGLLSAQIQFGLFFTLFIAYVFFYKYPKMNIAWKSFIFTNFVCLTAGSYFMVEMYFIRFFIPLLLLKSIDEKVKMEQLP